MAGANDTDVVVIGGGPAGSSAANALASAGVGVLLVDKAHHPRPTVGESVLPQAWTYFERLGVREEVERAGFIEKRGGISLWDGQLREVCLGAFGLPGPGLHVERDVLDDLLLRAAQRAGADVREGVEAVRVLFDGDRACGVDLQDEDGSRREVRARFVVDASGQRALIARQLDRLEYDPALRFLCVWGYYDDADYVAPGGVVHPFADRRDVPPVTFVAGRGDWGWAWHIAMQDSTSVGLLLPPDHLPAFKAAGDDLETRFAAAVRETPELGELVAPGRLRAGSVQAMRDFAFRNTEIAGPGWISIGDAAAFVDPVNSSGVVLALFGGFVAAMLAEEALAGPEREARMRPRAVEWMRGRLALFRVSALSPEAPVKEAEMRQAARAANVSGPVEQGLIYHHLHLIHRPQNLHRLLAFDPSLAFRETPHVQTLDRLTRSR